MKNTSEKITKTLTESSIRNNQALENLNNKLLENLNDRGILSSYLMTSLSKITNPDKTTQFKLVKDFNSKRVNDLLIHNTIPVSLHKNFLTFRDTGKKVELKAHLLKMITNKNYDVDLDSLADRKTMYVFAEELHFDVKAQGINCTTDRTLINLFKSPGLIVSASGISSTIFLPSDSVELSDSLKLLSQEKHAGNNSNIINAETIAIVDKVLEYKGISKGKDRQNFFNCNLLHEYK